MKSYHISFRETGALLLALVNLLQPAGAAEAAKDATTLSVLKLSFDVHRSQLLEPVKELQKRYEEQLNQLLDEVTQAGDLEQALAVRTEIESFKKTPVEPAKDSFPELKRLQQIYAKAHTDRVRIMNQKLAPLAASYRTQLEELKIRLTQEKKLDDAVEVQSEIAALETTLEEIAATQSSPPPVGARTQFRVGSPSEALTTDEGKEGLATIAVKGAEWKELKTGEPCYSDAPYKWISIPPTLQGTQFTLAGKHSNTLNFDVTKPGLVFIAVSSSFSPKAGTGDTWEKDALDEKALRSMGWRHLREFKGMRNETTRNLIIFYRECAANESISIRTEKYAPPFALRR